MKLSHLPLLACFLVGCQSPAWTKMVVDDGGGGDVGGSLSMHLHRDGQNKKLVLVYHDATAQRVRVATRTGSGASWDPFVVETIPSGSVKAHDPVSGMGPDGQVYVAFGQPDETSSDRTWRVYVATPTGSGGAWETDPIDIPANQPELRKTNDPPAIAFQRSDDGPGSVYVVWSTVDSRELVRATRALDDDEWFVSLIDDHEGRRPALLAARNFERMLLFFGDTGGGQGSPLVVSGSHAFGWGPPLPVGPSLAGSQARFHAKFVGAANSPDFGHVAVVHADCDGKPRLRVASDAIGSQFPTSVVPGVPTDPTRDFCEPSFAYDFQGRPYISAFDVDTESCIVFHVDPGPNQWIGEHIEAAASDAGHATSLVYDELADEFIVAYYHRGTGELKIATRDANSK